MCSTYRNHFVADQHLAILSGSTLGRDTRDVDGVTVVPVGRGAFPAGYTEPESRTVADQRRVD